MCYRRFAILSLAPKGVSNEHCRSDREDKIVRWTRGGGGVVPGTCFGPAHGGGGQEVTLPHIPNSFEGVGWEGRSGE